MNPFAPTTAFFVPQRALGPFTAYVTIEEVGTDDLEITRHPVELGAAITDHATVMPAAVTVRALFGPDAAPLVETYARLLELRRSRIPFTVVTGKRQYESMLMKSLSVTTDPLTENVLAVSMELQEVLLVAVETVTVPPRARQADASKTGATEAAGKKQAVPATATQAEKARSGLAALLGSGG